MKIKIKISGISQQATFSDKDGYTWTIAEEGEIIEKWKSDSANVDSYAELVEASPAGLCSILERTKDWNLYQWMVDKGGFGIYAVMHTNESKYITDQSLIKRNGAFYSTLVFDLSEYYALYWGRDIGGEFKDLQDDPEDDTIQELEYGTNEYHGGYAASYIMEHCAELIVTTADEEYTFEDAVEYWQGNGKGFFASSK